MSKNTMKGLVAKTCAAAMFAAVLCATGSGVALAQNAAPATVRHTGTEDSRHRPHRHSARLEGRRRTSPAR